MLGRPYYIVVLFLTLSLNCQESTPEIFDIRDEYYTVEKYAIFILFILFLLYGIATNTLMVIIFCCKRNNLNSRSFILISYQLIISAFLSFIPQVVIVLFGMLMIEKSFNADEKTWFHKIFATMDTFSFFGMLHFAFLLTVNRLVAMNFPKFNVVFESTKFYFLIAFVWLSASIISLAQFCLCTKTFIVSNLQWSSNCAEETLKSGQAFTKFLHTWTLTLPIMMFLMYILIFYDMRRKRRKRITTDQCRINKIYTANVGTRSGKYEQSMLIQAAVLCATIEVYIICYYFLAPLAIKIAGEKIEIPVNVFNNCYIIFSNAVLPTINLIFVKRFRNEIKYIIAQLFCKIINVQDLITVIPATLTKIQHISHSP